VDAGAGVYAVIEFDPQKSPILPKLGSPCSPDEEFAEVAPFPTRIVLHSQFVGNVALPAAGPSFPARTRASHKTPPDPLSQFGCARARGTSHFPRAVDRL
jgi:hypothetical protein